MVLVVVRGNTGVVAGDVDEGWRSSNGEEGSGGMRVADVLNEVINCYYAKGKLYSSKKTSREMKILLFGLRHLYPLWLRL